MIQRNDALERLRAVNPVPTGTPRSTPDPALFQRITSGETVVRTPRAMWPERRLRRARRLVPVVVVSSLLGGGLAYAVMRGGATKTDTVACYAEASLEATTAVVKVDRRGALAACADLWADRVFGGGAPAPALIECVLDSGVAGVFPARPGDDVCARLALLSVPSTAAPPQTGPGRAEPTADPATRFQDFRDAVLPQFLDGPCLDRPAAEAIVRRELARAGLGDWTVRGDGFTAERPCASLAFRPETQEVVLVPATPRR